MRKLEVLLLVNLCAIPASLAQPAAVSTEAETGMVFIKANTSTDGRAIPSLKGEQRVYTMADRRRIDNKFQGRRFYSRWFKGDGTQIARLDTKLLWDINHRRKEYQECEISGCRTDAFAENPGQDEENNEEYQTLDERECTVTPTLSEFKVAPTGKSRTIGTLVAEEYTVEWRLEFKDADGNSDRNLLQFVFWTVPPSEQMSQAWRVHAQFQDSLYSQWSDDPLLRLLGREGYLAVAAFAGDVEKRDPERYRGIANDLAIIKGYPISIKFEWYQKTGACPRKIRASGEAEPEGDLAEELKKSAMGAVSGLFKKVKKNVKEQWQKEPLIRYLYDVESVEYLAADRTKFELPAGYTITDRQ